MSDPNTLREELAAAVSDLQGKQEAIEQLEQIAKASKKNPDEVAAIVQFRTFRDSAQATVDKLTKQLETAMRTERTKTIVEPLIEKFGTLTVAQATEFRVEFVDVPALINKLNAEISAASSKLAALKHLDDVLEALEVSDDTAADLKAVRFEAAGPSTYKLAMARTAGTSGGTRTSRAGEIYTITAASENFSELVGMKIGKDQDFKNWKAVIEHAAPDKYTELEQKRLGTFPGKEGKHSNYSASLVAANLFGLEWDTAKV